MLVLCYRRRQRKHAQVHDDVKGEENGRDLERNGRRRIEDPDERAAPSVYDNVIENVDTMYMYEEISDRPNYDELPETNYYDDTISNT